MKWQKDGNCIWKEGICEAKPNVVENVVNIEYVDDTVNVGHVIEASNRSLQDNDLFEVFK